jgi:hypothetical protein
VESRSRGESRIRALAQAAADSLNYSGRAFVIQNDVIEDFPQLLQVEPVRREKALRGLRIAQNRRERLIELVNEGTGPGMGTGMLAKKQLPGTPASTPLRYQRRDQYQLKCRPGDYQ